jgi:hypothetical protein
MLALCKEEISRVSMRGHESEEKVFVTIRRRIGGFGKSYGTDQWKGKAQIGGNPIGGNPIDSSADPSTRWSKMGNLALVETRNLVFMREKTKEAAREDVQRILSGSKRIMRRQILVCLFPDGH